jgi:hypothetical protein
MYIIGFPFFIPDYYRNTFEDEAEILVYVINAPTICCAKIAMGFFRVADWIGRIIPVFKSQRLL